MARWLTCAFAAALALATAARASAQKQENWVEVRSAHFTIVSNAGEKSARRAAGQFEQFRSVFQALFPQARVDSTTPLLVFAVKDEKSLKALLPEYWEQKGRTQPAGVYFQGQDRDYAAVRLDTTSEYPYHVIYHEYVHRLNRMNFSILPLWLNEGLAELFGYATLTEKQSMLGRVPLYQLELLKQKKLLPLEVLLTVDHNSPHYNEDNKSSIFYAQSWALTHWLILADRQANFPKMVEYLRAIDHGMSEKDAAIKVFGDLKLMEQTLERYARQTSFFQFQLKTPEDIDEKSFPLRLLSPAEAQALRGDFYFHSGRKKEALASLQDALTLDPQSALANETLGMLYFREGERERAAQYLAQAVTLDSRSATSHYLYASILMSGVASASAETIETHLRKAIELKPDFAPAYSLLARLLASQLSRPEEALPLAAKAAQLEPGVFGHKANLLSVLIRLQRVDEAISQGEQLLRLAKSNEERGLALSVLESARQFKAMQAQQKQLEEERAAYLREKERDVAETPSALSPASFRPEGSVEATGTITGVNCLRLPRIQFTLDVNGKKLELQADDLSRVRFHYIGEKPPADFNPCQSLKGHRIKFFYLPVSNEKHARNVVLIEFREASPPRREEPAIPADSRGRPYVEAEGRIVSVTCSAPPGIRLKLDFGGYVIELIAGDASTVQYQVRGAAAPADFQPCKALQGKKAVIYYTATEGTRHAGEIAKINLP